MIMNITNAKYQANADGQNDCILVTIDSVKTFVPLDPDNRHWQAIQKWVAEGNTIAEAD